MKYIFENPESLIKEVQVHTPSSGLEVILYQPKGADDASISALKVQMEQSGHQVLAGEDEGRHVLRLYGFTSAQHALAELANNQAVKGDFKTQKNDKDRSIPQDVNRILRRGALFGAGAFSLAGNVNTARSAMTRGSGAELAQAAVWALPDFSLMLAATQTPEMQMQFLYKDMQEFLLKNQFHVPSNVQNILEDRAAGGGFKDKAVRFSMDYGPIFKNVSKILGSGMMFKAGFEGDNPYKMGASVLCATGMGLGIALHQSSHATYSSTNLGQAVDTVGMTTEEKQKAEQSHVATFPEPTKDHGFIGNLIAKANANPLFYSGSLALLNNALNIIGAREIDGKRREEFLRDEHATGDNRGQYWREKETTALQIAELEREKANISEGSNVYNAIVDNLEKKYADSASLDKKRDKYEKAAAAGSYINNAAKCYATSNILYMFASKNNGADLVQSGGINTVVEMAANIVHKYNPEFRDAITQRLSTFLGNHAYVPFSVDDMVQLINAKVKVMSSSAWIGNNERGTATFIPADTVELPSPKAQAIARTSSQVDEHIEVPTSHVQNAARESIQKMFGSQRALLTV